MISIYSSHGELHVDSDTGLVLPSSRYDGDGIRDITKFDIEEFCIFWGCEPESGDILDFGFWCGDDYTEPEMDWRLNVCIDFLMECHEELAESTTPGELVEGSRRHHPPGVAMPNGIMEVQET